MTAIPLFPSIRSLRPAFGVLALLAALTLPSAVLAQTDPAQDKDKKELSEKVRDGMAKYVAFQEAKDWDNAVAQLTELQKIAKPDSFEEFTLDYVKGQVFIQIDQFPKAIEPLEKALAVSDRHNFLSDKDERRLLKYLAQIYNAQGSAKGVPLAEQQRDYIKAGDYLKRLIDNERENHVLNTDDFLLYAYLLLQRAQANPEKPDAALLSDARKVSEEGLHLAITPPRQFYQLLQSILVMQNDYPAAAELIELMLKKDPSNKDNWTQLSAIYLTLGTDATDKQKALEYNIRAIVTYERAQAAGHLKTPKDNFALVSTYFNIGQIEPAARLLETDLKNGSIESDQKYWTYLAQWYQQINQELKAIEVLKEAAKHFPNSGDFDFMAAQNYYALEKFPDALQQARLAATKGLGDKTWLAWSLVAYTAYELRQYDEALEAVTKALSFPESKKDHQLPGLKDFVEKAIKEHNAQIEALKAKQK